MTTIDKLNAGDYCRIISYSDDSIASKLISMGVFPNAEGFLLDTNHKKHTFFLIVGSLKLGLLYNEAASIIVHKIENNGE